MRLERIMAELEGASLDGPGSVEIAGITHDSRSVRPGDLFVAVRGARIDGAGFVADAIGRGAAAVLSASPRQPGAGSVPWIQVPRERLAMAHAAAALYCHPDRELRLVGITGTNGKTTTAYLLESILAAAGRGAGVIGTVSYRWGGAERPAERTTPESPVLFRLLREMADGGCNEAVLEVSSHALDLDRVAGMRFEVAVFTNLSRDHLDYHRDMESYFSSKARLFEELPAEAWAVINADDPRATALAGRTRARLRTYGAADGADVRLLAATSTFDGSRLRVATAGGELEMETALPGRPNVWNVLAAAAAAQALGVGAPFIARGVRDLAGVPGRFERIRTGQPFEVIVDYAHTDDALRNVLRVVRDLRPSRVITVFGCGGDRDREKRPLMGEAAATGSDVVILTSDNPRGEDPEAIADDAEAGVRRAPGRFQYHRCLDRREAIRLALAAARPGDAVVVAGKGHERTQTIGSRSHAFDDRDVCRELLAERSEGSGG